MELKITPHVPGKVVQPFLPDNSIYEVLGEGGIRNMISYFYDLLIESDIKHLFPVDQDKFLEAKQRAADFIIQRFGGPDYYNQRWGKPLLVKRHEPFEITAEGRITWLKCYQQALLKQSLPEKVLLDYWRFIDEFSLRMVNSTAQNTFSGLKVAK